VGARGGRPRRRTHGLAEPRAIVLSARRTIRASAVALIIALALGCAATASASAPLRLGFSDNAFVGGNGSAVMDMASRSGGRLVRLNATWSLIAPSRPADEANPADPAYDFRALDAAVTNAVAKRLEPFVLMGLAPTWAEGPQRPALAQEDGPNAHVAPGSWKPDVDAYGRFATAVARRYSGSFTPAGASSPLPRVRRFQAWNEPNLNSYLSPQWERDGSRWRAFAPAHYRRMLNAFSAAIKAVHRDNFTITAGTAPYGNPAGEWRRRPLAFWRDVLCASTRCSDPARFDALAHHPYGAPLDDSFSVDDLPVRGIRRLVSVLRKVERLKRVRGAAHHRLWITELGLETDPPDPDGISLDAQENYLQLSLYLLWAAGADTITWFQVIDEDRGRGYEHTVQAGLYLMSGKPKLAEKAFAFPFATDPDRPRIYWGLAPARGSVRIERRSRGRWVLVRTVKAGAGRTFTGRGRWSSGSLLRARQGKRTSLTWHAL
jgi:hypothetical protein